MTGSRSAGWVVLTICSVALAACGGGLDQLSPTTPRPPSTTQAATTSLVVTTTTTSVATTTGPETRDISVLADGSGDYPGLAEAVSAAEPGATITLGPGTFDLAGPLDLETAIGIIGAGSDRTTITATSPGHIISFSAEGTLEMRGLTLEYLGDGEADGLVATSGVVDISDVLVAGAARGGDGSAGNGFLIGGRVRGTITDCRAEGNGGDGFRFTGRASPTVTSSRASHNGGDGFSTTKRASTRLLHNTADGNTGDGFYWAEDASGTAEGNTATENGLSGFSTVDRASPALVGNTARGNNLWGFEFDGGSTTVTDNRSIDHGVSGFSWTTDASSTATGNLARGNAMHGFYVGDEAVVRLIGNMARDNSSSGFLLVGQADGVVRDNEAFGNEDGLAVQDTVRARIGANDLHDNETDFLRFAGTGASVPDVIGKTREEAEALFQSYGVVPYIDPANACVESAEFRGLIARVEPAVGTSLPLYSRVQMWIGIKPGEACHP
jgi:parallel beta-helix repeat protein